MIDLSNDARFVPTEPMEFDGITVTSWYDQSKHHCFLWVVEWPSSRTTLLPWCLINPAIEQETRVNRTGKRLQRMTAAYGIYGGFVGINLHTAISMSPMDVIGTEDEAWDKNAIVFQKIAAEYDEIVCAWGNDAPCVYVHRALTFFDGKTLLCPGTTTLGNPRHPSRLSNETRLVEWSDAMWSID